MSNDQVEDPYTALDPQVKKDINDLTELGHIEDTVEYGGHSFGLRTLYIDEELAAARAIEQFDGNSREHVAYATAMVAASLTHVNGDPDFCPAIGSNVTENVRGRFQWVSKNWHWPIVEFLYQHVARLSQEQAGLIARVENLSEADQGGSFDIASLLIEQGIFNDETPGDSL